MFEYNFTTYHRASVRTYTDECLRLSGPQSLNTSDQVRVGLTQRDPGVSAAGVGREIASLSLKRNSGTTAHAPTSSGTSGLYSIFM